MSIRPKKSLCTSAFLIFFFCLAMKRCPIAAKIAGSIGILPCCVLNDFFTICEASISLIHHTLYMGNLVPAYTMYGVFPCWQKKRWPEKSASPHRFWSRPMTRKRRLYFGLMYSKPKNSNSVTLAPRPDKNACRNVEFILHQFQVFSFKEHHNSNKILFCIGKSCNISSYIRSLLPRPTHC